jgi:hypothetical protein
MTEQQEKLQQLVSRRTEVVEEATKLQKELQAKGELIIRIEGAIEAFSMLDIKLPEEAPEAPAAEATVVE